MKIWSTMCLVLALSGCGDNNMMMVAANPLVGNWKGTPPGGGSVALNIRSNATFDFIAAGDDASTGCSSTIDFTGTWTSTATTLSTVAASGTFKVIDCTDTTMNLDRAASSQELAAYSFKDASYTIVGTTLTVATGGGGDPQAFTKQ